MNNDPNVSPVREISGKAQRLAEGRIERGTVERGTDSTGNSFHIHTN